MRPSGAGKTHPAIALGYLATQRGMKMRSTLEVRGRRIRIEIARAAASTLLEGQELDIWHGEEPVVLTAAEPVIPQPVPQQKDRIKVP